MWQLYNHLHLLQFSFISAKNCLTWRARSAVLHCRCQSSQNPIAFLTVVVGFTHPENCIQRLLGSLENFPLISRGSDFVKKINKEKKIRSNFNKNQREQTPDVTLCSPTAESAHLPHCLPCTVSGSGHSFLQ